MNINELIDRIKTLIEPILTESGKIVFSSVDTIKKGELYTLGLNPGGEADIPIYQTLEKLPSLIWNAYLDERWGNRKKIKYDVGKHPLQRNFAGLIKAIGYNTADIFSTNLIFVRTRKQQKPKKFHYYADLCWKVHQEFIRIIDPKYLIVFGNSKVSPFQYIKDKNELEVSDSIVSGHGKWKCFSCKGIIEGKERMLIGVPHLSRYYINYHHEVIKWIRFKVLKG